MENEDSASGDGFGSCNWLVHVVSDQLSTSVNLYIVGHLISAQEHRLYDEIIFHIIGCWVTRFVKSLSVMTSDS